MIEHRMHNFSEVCCTCMAFEVFVHKIADTHTVIA